jgi:hypothetical protein
VHLLADLFAKLLLKKHVFGEAARPKDLLQFSLVGRPNLTVLVAYDLGLCKYGLNLSVRCSTIYGLLELGLDSLPALAEIVGLISQVAKGLGYLIHCRFIKDQLLTKSLKEGSPHTLLSLSPFSALSLHGMGHPGCVRLRLRQRSRWDYDNG